PNPSPPEGRGEQDSPLSLQPLSPGAGARGARRSGMPRTRRRRAVSIPPYPITPRAARARGPGRRRPHRRFPHNGRTEAKKFFTRDKPHVNVGTIGHIDHGKTTLTAAVVARQAHRFGGDVPTYADIARGGLVRDPSKIVTITVAHVEYETARRHYAHM